MNDDLRGLKGIELRKMFSIAVRTRRQLGISQTELGRRADLHHTYICDIERGSRNISLRSIVTLAKALQISLAELFQTVTGTVTNQ